MPLFSKLELENFKTYRQPTVIEWRQFTAIVGPNGSGKSSIVDAIEFVFCFPDYDRKSAKRLKSLICNKTLQNLADSCSTRVTITFDLNGTERIFERIINYKSMKIQYGIDNKKVSFDDYKKHLIENNINHKANNFLIRQNSIETIALQRGKERCEFFETISGSINYKEEYDKLKAERSNLVYQLNENKDNLKLYTIKRKDLCSKLKNQEKYEKLQTKLEQKESEYYFARFRLLDDKLNELSQERNRLQHTINITNKLIDESKEKIQEFKKIAAKHDADMQICEKELEKLQSKISKRLVRLSAINNQLNLYQENIKKVDDSLKKNNVMTEAHKLTLSGLEEQYQEVERNKNEYVKSLSQVCSLELQDKQCEEYYNLKSKAQERFADDIVELSKIERERDILKDSIEILENKKRQFIEEKTRTQNLVDTITSYLKNIDEKTVETTSEKEAVNDKINEVKEKMKSLIEEREDLISEIVIVDDELKAIKDSNQENEKFRRNKEVLLLLKKTFGDKKVIDRFADLYELYDDRYKIAIMKIIGKKMNNIVVDTEITAKKCIQFIKNHYKHDKNSIIETFLPLDFIKVKSLENVKKKIENEKFATMASDVMLIQESMIKVVEHICGDVVICETDDQASDLSFRKHINCVSLNGTFAHKNGIISGGLASLEQTAKKWDSQMAKKKDILKEEKEKKSSRLRELQALIRKSEESKNINEIKLKGLDERLRFLISQKNQKIQELEKQKEELLSLDNNQDLEKLNMDLHDTKAKLENTNEAFRKLEAKKKVIEDETFQEFCEELGLSNIRQYELGDFKKHKEQDNAIKELDNHLDKIRNQIEYENSRDIKSTEKKLKLQRKKLESKYNELVKRKEKIEKKNTEDISESGTKNEYKLLKDEIDKQKKEALVEESKLKRMKKDLNLIKVQDSTSKATISRLIAEKHELLLHCKVNNIDIPFKKGSIGKLLPKNAKDTSSFQESTDNSNNSELTESILNESEVEIDYRKLPGSIKNVDSDAALDKLIKFTETEIQQLNEELSQIEIDTKSKEHLKVIDKKLDELKEIVKKNSNELVSINKSFENVKTKRCQDFHNFYNLVSTEIDEIIKDLYKSQQAQAFLHLVNPEEPYLDGINYHVIIPGKRFSPTENLSGGEKTMSALALFLATFRASPAPLLILDEIDAALDNRNIQKVVAYFSNIKTTTQIIVVSHHISLTRYGDACIAIHISIENDSSCAIHVDLTKYQKETSAEKCLKNTSDMKLQLL